MEIRDPCNWKPVDCSIRFCTPSMAENVPHHLQCSSDAASVRSYSLSKAEIASPNLQCCHASREGVQRMNGCKAFHAGGMSHMLCFSMVYELHHTCNPGIKFRALVDGLKAQQTRASIEWENVTIDEAFNSLEQITGLPSVEYLICMLQRCIQSKNLGYAKRLHLQIHDYGLESHGLVGNYLVPLFVECGSFPLALQVLDRLADRRNEYSWASIIKGFVECGESPRALNVSRRMQEDHVHPGKQTHLAILKACSKLKYMERGQATHVDIVKEGLEKDLYVGNSVIDLYAKCGSLAEAQDVFGKLPARDVVSWNALITGYVEDGLCEEALKCLDYMQLEGVSPNAVTFVCSLKACHSIGAIDTGLQIHTDIIKEGYERNTFLGSTLVDVYAKCGSLREAQQVFDELPSRDVVPWTALIAGYAEHGFGEQALLCLDQMQLEVSPNAVTYVCILKACGNIGALGRGQDIHSEIVKEEFDRDSIVGNTLVDMYVKCGSLAEAQDVFDMLPSQDVVSWTALIAGYTEHGLAAEALNTLEQMQVRRVSPNAVTHLCAIGACGSLGAIDRGQELHIKVVKEGFDTDSLVGSGLVDMYARCGSLAEAQEEFDKLLVRDIISWSALIAGYTELGLGKEALNNLEQMKSEGIIPDAVTFVSVLKACGSIQAIDRGQEIHIEIVKEEFERDPFIGNKLVDLYAKCGLLAEARDVFNDLALKDDVSWNALLAGYAEHGNDKEAQDCLERMQFEGVDYVTSICSLKSCGSIRALDRGQELHTEMVKEGLERDLFIAKALVDMYANCGTLSEAQGVFDEMLVRDVVSWNTLIAGYAEHGLGQEALDCFERMQLEGISPDAVTYLSSWRACGRIGALEKGQELHAEIAKYGFERDPLFGNALLDMYSKCGSLLQAQDVFDELPSQDVVSWNTLITGYAKHGLAQEALHCLEQMELKGLPLDAVTFVGSLNACGSKGAIDKGQALHVKIVEEGFDMNVFVGNSLVDMYAKCGLLTEALAVFDDLPVHDTVSWNALTAGYAEHGLGKEVFNCLEQMQLEGMSLDAASFVCSLKSCASTGAIRRGQELHAEIVKEGFERNTFVGTALVDMYAKCGLLSEARELFDELLLVHDVVLWSSMILGYAEHGESEMALTLYAQMQEQGLLPNSLTFAAILKACGNVADLETGKKYHAQIYRLGKLIATEVILTTALIDMYAKCGRMLEAQQVFDAMRSSGLVRWSALIAGYARQGESEIVFQSFEKMREEGILPDGVTFLSLLNTCSHVGLVNHGWRYFEVMMEYGITPDMKHYNCMVDLFGRAGQLDEAVLMLKKIPFQPDLVAWSTLMDACRRWGVVDLGRQAFENVVCLDETRAGAFILMSNIYADAHVLEKTTNEHGNNEDFSLCTRDK